MWGTNVRGHERQETARDAEATQILRHDACVSPSWLRLTEESRLQGRRSRAGTLTHERHVNTWCVVTRRKAAGLLPLEAGSCAPHSPVLARRLFTVRFLFLFSFFAREKEPTSKEQAKRPTSKQRDPQAKRPTSSSKPINRH